MKKYDSRVARVDEDAGAGDTGLHGPEERTAADNERSGFAQASDEERASGGSARASTGRPAPPPREDEEPASAQAEVEGEEFRDAEWLGETGEA
jgi:hypothetical protein